MLFKKHLINQNGGNPMNQRHDQEAMDTPTGQDHHEDNNNQGSVVDEHDFEAEASAAADVPATPRKRAFPAAQGQSDDGFGSPQQASVNPQTVNQQTTASSAPATPSPAVATRGPKPQSTTEERVCLTTKLRQPLHARLRIHAFRTHKSISSLIEEWIDQNCPE